MSCEQNRPSVAAEEVAYQQPGRLPQCAAVDGLNHDACAPAQCPQYGRKA